VTALRARVLAALAAVLLAPAFARALQVDLQDIQSGLLTTDIAFGDLFIKNHKTSGQFMRVRYPFSTHRKVLIYTDNSIWGVANPMGGLVSLASHQEEMPLYWIDAPVGTVDTLVFSTATEASWHQILDLKNPATASALIPLASLAAGETGVRLGAVFSNKVPSGEYRAKVVLQEVSDVPDITPPRIFFTPFQRLLFTGRPLTFKVTVQDDVQVTSVTFHYRLPGQSAYTDVVMTLTPDPTNPFQMIAKWSLSLTAAQLGGLDYYFTASDGVNDSTFLNATAFFASDVLPQDAPVCSGLSAAGGLMSLSVGDPDLGPMSLAFRPRSLSSPRTICTRFLDPRSLPSWKGQQPVSTFEFSPGGIQFDAPVDLTLIYEDQDQDGRVDGDGREEAGLKLFWFDGLVWRYVGGRADIAANHVTAPITHFSIYGLFAAPALTAEDVRPAERIFTPNGDGVNDNLTFNAPLPGLRISIFDAQGRKVRGLDGNNVWNGRKDDGDMAETGVYVYKVETDGLTVTGTVGVAR
jgi:gliding motility-associated-like protein